MVMRRSNLTFSVPPKGRRQDYDDMLCSARIVYERDRVVSIESLMAQSGKARNSVKSFLYNSTTNGDLERRAINHYVCVEDA